MESTATPFFLRDVDMASDYWEPLIPFLSTTTTNSNNSNQISYESHLISSHHIPFLELLQCAIQQKEELDDQEQHQPLESCITNTTTPSASRKKRKRSRPTTCCKSPEEVESQRMTHIAVERNRRRLMNHHLASLRSLMPSSYVQRGDQASVVGGAIDLVKELEQLLLSLQSEKRLREEALESFFISPQYTSFSNGGNGAAGVDVEATVVQGHVNLKVVSARRPGQLVKVVAALEELCLTVLHLNVTSMDSSSVLYSLNLKMEEECRLGSADEIATAVYQLFCCINGS
ncbi:transcription factor bHLH70-like [Dioscorea cayenensis subsp. rotundata]|uniref:Transcription factor bHLH70-like n=1 Tax=Dioscorea cayennensis subsp. rotundata TaxID=55577 RepID=A0AB40AK86_DIOCR|nr:transcription factor bHLH70-like [Dioscorea cayenensis subsp. rotundata]